MGAFFCENPKCQAHVYIDHLDRDSDASVSLIFHGAWVSLDRVRHFRRYDSSRKAPLDFWLCSMCDNAVKMHCDIEDAEFEWAEDSECPTMRFPNVHIERIGTPRKP